MKKLMNALRKRLAKPAAKRGKKRESAFAVVALPVIALLAVVTIVVILMLRAVPSTEKPKEPAAEEKPQIAHLLPVGEHRPGTDGFYTMQSDFYDYYYPLIGFGHISFSGEDGRFSDSELIQFALIRLNYEDAVNVSDGVSGIQIEKMIKRHFGVTPTKLEGYYLTYDAETQKYYPKNDTFIPGVLMSLQKLNVGEDGVCTAEFYRSKMPDADFITAGGQSEEDFKQSFLNGYHEGLDDIQRIRMIFHQDKNADGNVYNVIHSIEQIVA